MTQIKAIYSKVDSLVGIVENIVSTVEDLDFDWCSEPVEVYVTKAERAEGMNSTFNPRFEILVENEYGYFGFYVC